MTYDRPTGVLTLYRNGVQVAQQAAGTFRTATTAGDSASADAARGPSTSAGASGTVVVPDRFLRAEAARLQGDLESAERMLRRAAQRFAFSDDTEAQAEAFHAAVGLTGIVLTKLDSTARGGIVFAIWSAGCAASRATRSR